MARERNTQPPDPGVGPPPSGSGRDSDILHVEVAKIQSDGEHVKSTLIELRSDMREMRDRMARVEVELKHLPSKGFIVAIVTTFLLIAGGLLTIAPKLWNWVGVPTITAPAPK